MDERTAYREELVETSERALRWRAAKAQLPTEVWQQALRDGGKDQLIALLLSKWDEDHASAPATTPVQNPPDAPPTPAPAATTPAPAKKRAARKTQTQTPVQKELPGTVDPEEDLEESAEEDPEEALRRLGLDHILPADEPRHTPLTPDPTPDPGGLVLVTKLLEDINQRLDRLEQTQVAQGNVLLTVNDQLQSLVDLAVNAGALAFARGLDKPLAGFAAILRKVGLADSPK